MDARALEPAIEVFSKHLLEHFGCVQVDDIFHDKAQRWDLILQKGDKMLLVEMCIRDRGYDARKFLENRME